MDAEEGCDYLRIYDGNKIIEYSVQPESRNIQIFRDNLMIKFESDWSNNAIGFILNFTAKYSMLERQVFQK